MTSKHQILWQADVTGLSASSQLHTFKAYIIKVTATYCFFYKPNKQQYRPEIGKLLPAGHIK